MLNGPKKPTLFYLFTLIYLCITVHSTAQNNALNQQIIDTINKHGKQIAPSYTKAVCTEFVIGVLEYFITLDSTDKSNIRIDQPRESIEDVYHKIKNGSPEPKGVYYALTTKGFGLPITDWRQVKRGDFVQFWYPDSWGHCGIVESINLNDNSMRLHSSFPSTNGYGIQEFQIPSYTWFVRLMIP